MSSKGSEREYLFNRCNRDRIIYAREYIVIDILELRLSFFHTISSTCRIVLC